MNPIAERMKSPYRPEFMHSDDAKLWEEARKEINRLQTIVNSKLTKDKK